MTEGVVWLASYPKSGNTWLRAFLANYLRDPSAPTDINAIGLGPAAPAKVEPCWTDRRSRG